MPPLLESKRRWVIAPLSIYAATRLIAGLMLAVGAKRQEALTDDGSGYKITVPTPESPGYLGVVSNWDGQWYRAIAEDGYPSVLPRVGGEVVPNEWAFTPGYPFLVRVVATIGRIDFPLAATIVSLLCGALAVTILYGMVRRWMDDFAAGSLVLGLCCFPASPVLQVAYSESLSLLLVVLALRALTQRQYGWLVVCAALLSVTRPILLPLALLGSISWLTRWRRRDEEPFPMRERRTFAATCLACVAMVGVWPAIAAIATGEAGAFTQTMAVWPVNKELGGATVNWLTLAANDPLGWGIIVLPLIAVILWTALRRPSRAIPWTARAWAPAYVMYMLAATKPSAGLLRYLLLAIFPMMPLMEPNTSAVTRADKAVRLVLLGTLAVAGLVGQYFWVTKIFIIDQAPDLQLFP